CRGLSLYSGIAVCFVLKGKRTRAILIGPGVRRVPLPIAGGAARPRHARRSTGPPGGRQHAARPAPSPHREAPPAARVVTRGRPVRGAVRADRRAPPRPGEGDPPAPARVPPADPRGPSHAHRALARLRNASAAA